MSDRAAFFEAVLKRIHARMRGSTLRSLSAEEVEREAARWISVLNRLAELAEALIAADLRMLAHWCYAWAFALDPTLSEDPAAQQQVRANLALSGMLHPTLEAEIHEDRFELFFQAHPDQHRVRA